MRNKCSKTKSKTNRKWKAKWHIQNANRGRGAKNLTKTEKEKKTKCYWEPPLTKSNVSPVCNRSTTESVPLVQKTSENLEKSEKLQNSHWHNYQLREILVALVTNEWWDTLDLLQSLVFNKAQIRLKSFWNALDVFAKQYVWAQSSHDKQPAHLCARL
jgi:hypothetical protein